MLDDSDYNEALDGKSGERLLNYVEHQEGASVPATGYIPNIPDTNYVTKEADTSETSTAKSEENKPQSRLHRSKNLKDSVRLDHDWDANHESRILKLIMQEKKNLQYERSNLLSDRKQLAQERNEVAQERNNLEQERIGFQSQVELLRDLLPIATEIRMMGFDFSTANAWLTSVKNMSIKKGLDMRSAAWYVTDSLSKWEELGGYDIAISNAKHQLELLNMAVDDRKEEIAMAADLRKLGLGLNDIKNLMETVNNGHVKKFEFDSSVEVNAR